MKLSMHHIIATATLCVLSVLPSLACTSFIVSGKATKSGRPMIFKNRDTGNLDNCMVTVKGERYRFMGVAAAKDSANTEIWSGHNEAGFAIMNTAAYNLNGDTEFEVETEGMLMRQALALCATLKDFEALLDTTSLRNNNANFGVIDAQGGCAYYEVGLHKWTKFDANDPNVAPYGFLIRTNHAYSGDRTMDLGTERYLAINKFMTQQAFAGCFDAPSLIRTVPRILTHGLTNVNILDLAPEDNAVPRFANFVDFIPRFSTSCAQLIEGVNKDEDPSHTVAWTIIGSPLATVAMPLVLLPNDKLPETVGRGTTGGSTLCRYGLKLKERLFPLRTKTRSSYIDVAYNVGKSASADSLKKILPGNSYAEQDVYLLPPAEWVSKYVSIAAYNGAFSLRRIEEAVGKEAMRPYLDVLRFCLAENLMTVDNANNWVCITPHGFKHYGAVFSLFT